MAIFVRQQKPPFIASNPSEAYIQHLHEVAALHWPRKDLGGKPGQNRNEKLPNKVAPPFNFNRKTSNSPTKAHPAMRKRKNSS